MRSCLYGVNYPKNIPNKHFSSNFPPYISSIILHDISQFVIELHYSERIIVSGNTLKHQNFVPPPNILSFVSNTCLDFLVSLLCALPVFKVLKKSSESLIIMNRKEFISKALGATVDGHFGLILPQQWSLVKGSKQKLKQCNIV